MRTAVRWPAEVLTGTGVLAIVALVVLVARTGRADVAGASALALAFFVAGVIGARARPDHTGVLLLLAMGTAHLAGFALTAWAGATAHPAGWAPWLAALIGDACYLAGFVLLALLV